MSYVARLMQQTATHWELADTSVYDQYGDPSFKSVAPQLLSPEEGKGVRWEDRTEKFINQRGDEDHSKAIVWSAVTEFAVGDYLYRGTSTATNPETVSGADRIKRIERVWDLKGRISLYKAML